MKSIKDLSPDEVQREWRNAKRKDSKALETLGKHTASLCDALSSDYNDAASNIAYNGGASFSYDSEAEVKTQHRMFVAAWTDLGVDCQLIIDPKKGEYGIIFVNTINQTARRNRGHSGLDEIAEALMHAMPKQDAREALSRPRLTVFNPQYDWVSDIVWNGGHSVVYGEKGNSNPAALYNKTVARFAALAEAWKPFGISCDFLFNPWCNDGYVDVDFDADALYVRPQLSGKRKTTRINKLHSAVADSADMPVLQNGAATELVDNGTVYVDLNRSGDNARPSEAYRAVWDRTEGLREVLKTVAVETKIVFDPTQRDGSIGLLLKDRMTTKGSPMHYK